MNSGSYAEAIAITAASSVLEYNSSGSQSFGGAISGAGALKTSSTGTLTLTAASGFTGTAATYAVALSGGSGLTLGSGAALNSLAGGVSLASAALTIQAGASLTTSSLFYTGDLAIGNGVVNQTGGTVSLTTSNANDTRLGHWATTGNHPRTDPSAGR